VRANSIDDFFQRIDFSSECWIWTSTKDQDDYGVIKLEGKTWRAGRLMLVIAEGDLSPELLASATCHNPACIRPGHLFVSTQREVNLRGNAFSGRNARKTHCPRGHELPAANARGERNCQICAGTRSREWMRANYRPKKVSDGTAATV